ncbi:MAG: hypothetical protein F4020_00225 [Gammaproteobacteria bacterium]|nr:hypothetical protein [Gammaproteobacteria bacterium]MYK68037.1 hypothetical protein [Gammaproteobacteria bacterium]
MRMRRVIAPLASIMVFCTACESAPEAAPVILMDPVATSEAPLTGINSIALADETTACVIESYEERIHCLGRDGEEVGAFGRPGEGPGEFRSLMEVVGGPNATIGAIDWGLARMTVFETTGTRVSEVNLPFFGPYRATASFDSVLFGYGMASRSGDLATGLQTLHTGLDLASGDILWERGYPVDLLETGCDWGPSSELSLGVPTPTGGIVFPACGGLMILLEDRDGDAASLVEAPLYVEEFRTEAEVDAFAAQQRTSMFGSEATVERYRTTPLRYNVGRPIFDDRDQLWVLTRRFHEGFSHLDIYAGTRLIGVVQVRDRAVGFDLRGSTLVILTDRPVGPEDPDGYPDRAIDWYDIGKLEIGR